MEDRLRRRLSRRNSEEEAEKPAAETAGSEAAAAESSAAPPPTADENPAESGNGAKAEAPHSDAQDAAPAASSAPSGNGDAAATTSAAAADTATETPPETKPAEEAPQEAAETADPGDESAEDEAPADKKPVPDRDAINQLKHELEEVAAFDERMRKRKPKTPVTIGLIAVSSVFFVVLLATRLLPLPEAVANIGTILIGLGANVGPLTTGGQWWRALTTIFLCQDPFLFGVGMWFLWTIGRQVERLFGSLACLGIYCAAGIGGSLAMLLLQPASASFGPMDGVYGLYAAWFAAALVNRKVIPKRTIVENGYAVVWLVLLSIMLHFLPPHVGGVIPLGGALCGFLLGLAATPSLDAERKMPVGARFAPVAAVLVLWVAAGWYARPITLMANLERVVESENSGLQQVYDAVRYVQHAGLQEEATKRLEGIATKDKPAVAARAASAVALMESPSAEATAALAQLLKVVTNTEVAIIDTEARAPNQEIEKALKAVHETEAVAPAQRILLAAAQAGEPTRRLRIAYALLRLDPTKQESHQAFKSAVSELEDEDFKQVGPYTAVLSLMGPPAAPTLVEILAEELNRKEVNATGVRATAIRSLGRMAPMLTDEGAQFIVRLLGASLQTKPTADALYALGNFGPRAREATPLLLAYLQGNDPQVSAMTEQILPMIAQPEDLNQQIAANPGSARLLFVRGLAHQRLGNYAAARGDLEQSVRLDPKNVQRINRLAWLLAVCPDESVRDGKQAVRYVEQVMQLDDNEAAEATHLMMLAAAQAAAGDYQQAQTTANRAISTAEEAEQKNLAGLIGKHLEKYQQGQPWIEPTRQMAQQAAPEKSAVPMPNLPGADGVPSGEGERSAN